MGLGSKCIIAFTAGLVGIAILVSGLYISKHTSIPMHKKSEDTASIHESHASIPVHKKSEDTASIQNESHAARFARDLPNNIFLTYENCGHAPMLEELEKCPGNVVTFFEAR